MTFNRNVPQAASERQGAAAAPDHVVPQPGVRLVIGPALDADERTRAIADFLAEHPIGLSAATSAGSDSEGRVAKRTAKGRVPGIAQMLSAGSDWIDQYASPLGKRKHLRLCREGVLPCRKDGKQRLVRRADLDAYIMRSTKPGKLSDVNAVDRELDAFADVVDRGSR